MVATGGEHGCEPVPEVSGEAREGGGGANGGVSEALQKVWYPSVVLNGKYTTARMGYGSAMDTSW